MPNWDDLSPTDPTELSWDALSKEPPKPIEGGFTASVKQAAGATIKGAGQLASDFIPGIDRDNAVARYGQEVIDANPTAVRSLEDIKDRPWTAVKEGTGNAASSVAQIVGARAVGMGITAAAPLAGPAAPAVALLGQAVAWLGPAAVASLPSYGSIREKQLLKDPTLNDDMRSKAIAALGAATVGAIETKFGPQEWALSALTKEGRKAIAEKFAETTAAKAIGFGALKGAAIEGAEELAQNPVEQLASYDDPTTPESVKDTLFGGAMGTIGGGVLGGGTGIMTGRSQNQTIPPIQKQPDVKDITDAPNIDAAIAAADAALGAPLGPVQGAGMAPANPLMDAARGREAAEVDLAALIESETRNLQVLAAQLDQESRKQAELDQMQATGRQDLGRLPDQQVAAAAAATDETPTAMQLAMQRALAKKDANVSPSTAVPPSDTGAPGGGGVDAAPSLDTGVGIDSAGLGAGMEQGSPAGAPAGAAAPAPAADPLATLRTENAALRAQALQALQPQPVPAAQTQAAPSVRGDVPATGLPPAGPATLETGGLTLAKPSARQAAIDAEKARLEEKRAARRAAAQEAAKPMEGLSVGSMPTNAEPVSVKDGVVYIGKYPAQNFDTGEDITVPAGATPQQIAAALKESGALGKRAKVFGLQPAAESQAPAENIVGRKDSAQIAQPVESLGKTGPERSKAGDRARARAHDANPFKAFIAKHGIINALASEFAPGRRERQAALVQGYGPIFRNSGMQLDALAEMAVQDGYLTSPDVAKLSAMISDALRGKRIIPQYAEGAAETEMEARAALEKEADEEQNAEVEAETRAEREAIQAVADLSDGSLQAMAEDDVVLTAGNNVSEADFLRALGATEQEIQDATQGQERTGQDAESRQGPEETAAGAAPRGAESRDGQARADDEGLTAPTRADIEAQQDRAETTDTRSERPSPVFKVGDLVKLTKAGTGGRVKIAGTIKIIFPNGDAEVKTQNDGYMTVKQSDLTPANAETLTAPTREDVLAQQDRAETAPARDQREQVRRESEAGAGQFGLNREEGRQDTTGSLFDKPDESSNIDDGIRDNGKIIQAGFYSDGYPWQTDWKQESGVSVSQDGKDILAAGEIYRADGMKLRDAIRHAEIKGDTVPKAAYEKLKSMRRKDAPAAAEKPISQMSAADLLRAAADKMEGKEKPAETSVVKRVGSKVEDFGEKLPPARRAMAAKLDESLSDEKIATLPFSQVWPAAENDAIEDTFAAAVAHTARAEVPAKPRVAYKVKRWVEQVKTVRGLASMIVSGKVTRDDFLKRSGEYALKGFIAKVKLLEQLDRTDWKRIGAVSEAPDAFQYSNDGKEKIAKPMVSVTIDDRHHWIEGSGDILQHADAIKAMLGKGAPESRMQFEIRQESRGDRKVFINKKGDKEHRRLMEFATVEEARAAMKDKYADLVAAWEGVKDRDNITERDLRTAENRPRAGKDHRGGKDVTAEEFQEQFGFRGGEFGKWVSQGAGKQERQFFLNSAYDALMDLSDLLGIPPKAISLEGSLGLAFGSRGGGWASAHFEPSNLVINLTKPRGAGALAHEWFHALDNYFARKRGGEAAFTGNQDQYRRDNYVTYKTTPMMVRKDGRGTPVTKERLEEWRKGSPGQGYLAADQWIEDPNHKQGVRAEVEQKFEDLVKALNASPMLKRARVLDGKKEAEGYWSQVIERAARSFENYVQTRMMEQGYHNDFLANVKAAVDVGKNPKRYPYLLPDEIAPIAEAFDNLFQTIETVPGEGGNIVLREPDAPAYTGGYETDLFGNPVPNPAGANRPTRPAGAPVRGNVQPAAGLRDTPAPRGDYFVRTIVGTETSRQLGANRILTPADAAQATAYLYKSAVERFDAIVTDKAGKPLAVVGGFKGAMNQTSVYPSTVMGEAIRVPGAARIWFSHNHPSGLATLSQADMNLSNKMGDTFRGSGIKPMGVMAVAGLAFEHQPYVSAENNYDGTITAGPIPEPIKGASVPVIDRDLVDGNVYGREEVGGPLQAKDIARRFYMQSGGPGLVLMDSQNRVSAWVHLPKEAQGRLRNTGGLAALYRAASESNAGAAIIVHGGELDEIGNFPSNITASQNIASALAQVDVRPLDSINAKTGVSASEAGANIAFGPVYARGATIWRSALRDGVATIPAKAQGADGWRAQIQGLVNKGSVKQDEIEWSGVTDWLKIQTGKVTKEQVLEYLDGNGVQVEEVLLASGNAEQAAFDAVKQYAEDNNMYFDERGTNGYGYLIAYGENNSLSEEDGAEVRYEGRPAIIAEEIGLDYEADETKYGQYTLPGGTNYREVLLTYPAPVNMAKREAIFKEYQPRIDALYAAMDAEQDRMKAANIGADLGALQHERNERAAREAGEVDRTLYKSSHWNGTPNVLAHIRVNDRFVPRVDMADIAERIRAAVGAKSIESLGNGAPGAAVKKGAVTADEAAWYSHSRKFQNVDARPAPMDRILFVEEIQSDWGQEGKKKGFRKTDGGLSPAEEARFQVLLEDGRRNLKGTDLAEFESLIARRDAEAENRSAPPSAPFVTKTDAWLNLALKRVITMAAQEGYDRVAFVNGEQSAERYDLSKQVESIDWKDLGTGGKFTTIKTQDGQYVEFKAKPDGTVAEARGSGGTQFNGQPLDAVVGKDIAAKIMEADSGKLSGLDLKVGGEGMKTFYDQIVPNATKALLKKLGGGELQDVVTESSRMEVQERDDGFIIFDKKTKSFYRGGSSGRPWVDYPANARVYLSKGTAEKAAFEVGGVEVAQIGFDITPTMREKAAQGLPMFAKRGTAGGLSTETTQSVIDKIAAKWVDGPEVIVVASTEDLPIQAPADARGLHIGDKIYVVAGNNRTDLEVQSTLAHEVVAHYGLRNMLGRDGWHKMMANIQLARKAGNKSIREISDYVRQQYTDADGKFNLSENQEADEIAARAVELAIDHDTGEFNPGFGFLKSVWAKIADFLRGMGFTIKFTNTELQGMLVDAARFLEAGKRSGPAMYAEPAMALKIDQTETPEFKKWFGDSKVVDDQGKPLVVYHGTRPGVEINEFRARNENDGIYFTPDPLYAEGFTEELFGDSGAKGAIYPVYLSVNNPYIVRADDIDSPDAQKFLYRGHDRVDLERNGHDGAMLYLGGELDQIIAFRPEQIKSATGNRGTFDPKNPDIRYALSRATDPTGLNEIQQGKQAAKAAVRAELAAGRITAQHAFRGGYIPELRTIARTGQLMIRSNAEGEAGISAATVGDGQFAAYGAGSGYIVPPAITSKSGLVGEVLVDPKADPTTLTYVFNGKIMDFDAMKAAVLGDAPAIKSKEATDAEAWLADFLGGNFARKVIVGETPRQHTPEQLRAMRNVGFEIDVPTMKERAQAIWKDAGKKLAQGIVDQFAPVKVLDRVAYGLLRLSKGASGAFEVFLRGGKLKLTDGVYDFDDQAKGGVIDKLLIPLHGEHHDALRWVAANRAQQLLNEWTVTFPNGDEKTVASQAVANQMVAQNPGSKAKAAPRENLFTQADIDAFQTLADGTTDFDYTIQIGPQKGQITRDRTRIYADFNRVLKSFNDNVLDMTQQSGGISAQARVDFEREFYLPFFRDMGDDGILGPANSSGAVRQQFVKRLSGGQEKLNSDLLENMLMNWAHLLDAAAKNRAAKATIEAAEKMGAATQVADGTKKSVWFMDNGQKHHAVVDDPYLLTAITSLEYAGMRNPVMNAMGAFKHYLTMGVTASPFFKVRNLIRDSMQVLATSSINPNPLANVGKGWALTNPQSDEYFRLMAGGGTIHFGTMLEGSEAKRVQALVESGVDDASILNNDHKVKQFYRKFVEPGITAYNELGNRGEAINRASLYDQLRRQGVSHADASLQARDLMDFSMQGSFTTIRFLTQVVPFFNARLQGMYKLGRAAKEDPQRMAAVIGATALFSLALLAAYGDDDDWKKREEWDRNNYWWFKFGGTAFRIPKPFEIGAMATLAERGFELMFDDEMTGKRFRKQVMTLLGDNLSMNPVPQLVKPILDVYANKDSFTGRPIETMGMDRLESEYRFTSRTSMLARSASTTANAVTGLVGVEAPSPVQIDHMLRGYFGWLGAFIVGSADTMLRPMTGQPDRAAPDLWKVATGGMVADVDSASSRYVSQMYEQAKEIDRAYATWRNLVKEGKTLEAGEYLEEHRDEIRKHRSISSVKAQESRLNQRIRMIERSNMDADKKRDQIRKLQEQKDRIARRVAQ